MDRVDWFLIISKRSCITLILYSFKISSFFSSYFVVVVVWVLKEHQLGSPHFLAEDEPPRLKGMSRFLVKVFYVVHLITDQRQVPTRNLSFRKRTRSHVNTTISPRRKLLGKTRHPTFAHVWLLRSVRTLDHPSMMDVGNVLEICDDCL